ncbi:glucosyltransferase domain-containing protein [Citrobacter freundii]|uniref:glucosyltransferase domain-containing protein n=1 Tax=Citrobacter freundii TaxID=546 RepID=UPI000D74BD7F|nr:glucosyltransferase domain-containing protein [Citrobacter freundii]ELQ7796196.1 glucosyltransferase domain-containing protein [Citrobacter freundii]MBE0099357.1 hypothetical protein [Citrobacter freundii]MEA8854815.1 glucosyltransferase domain-containing protein [Citrobacter freundii]MEB0998578.1 glucosyltransferase domain-containing protein [Citrobacter freundii]PXH02841.1 hypothetical protein DMR07_06305 [Citrobacter freundii]
MSFKMMKKYFTMLIIFALPIILANQYYVDDIGRSSAGYTMWGIDGRPAADLIMTIFNLSYRLSDLSPLPLIVSCAILSMIFYGYKKTFLDESKEAFLIPLAFIINPAMLSILSYRFDVLTFTCSILFAFSPYLTKLKYKPLEYFAGVIFVILAASTYQISINIFAILSVVELAYGINKLESPSSILKRLTIRIAQAVTGMLAYMFVILPISFSGVHASNHPTISNNIISSVINNAHSYYLFASSNFYRTNCGEIIAAILLTSILCSVVLLARYHKKYEGAHFYMISIFCLASVALSLPMVVGSLLILSNSIEGALHVYMSFGVYLMLVSTLLFYCMKAIRFTLFALALPIFYSYTTMYSYGNALRTQDVVNRQLAMEIKQSLNNYNNEPRYIVFNGSAKTSLVYANSSVNYPAINHAVINYYYNWYWAIANLSMNGVNLMYPDTKVAEEAVNSFCSYSDIRRNQDFNMYVNKEVVVVDFDKIKCK